MHVYRRRGRGRGREGGKEGGREEGKDKTKLRGVKVVWRAWGHIVLPLNAEGGVREARAWEPPWGGVEVEGWRHAREQSQVDTLVSVAPI